MRRCSGYTPKEWGFEAIFEKPCPYCGAHELLKGSRLKGLVEEGANGDSWDNKEY